MEFSKKRVQQVNAMRNSPGMRMTVREQRAAAKELSERTLEYPSPLQMYERPPKGDISLQQFEDMAVERLKVLRTIEKHNMGGSQKYSNEWIEKIKADLEKNQLSAYLDLANLIGNQQKIKHLQNRKTDHVSHFILRLAYCRSDELRRWFVNHETELFRLKWKVIFKDNSKLTNEFMKESELHYTPISKAEKDGLGSDLMSGTSRGISGHKLADDDFYKVPWIEAVDLVRSRRVLVRNGFAYIPRDELMSLVVGVFRSRLSHNLVLTCRALPILDNDKRLIGLLRNFDKRYTGEEFSAGKSTDRVSPAMVPELAETHFPACMSVLQNTLKTSHHLKYKGRLQYGLFLKGIGMSLEDAIKFWRTELTKKGEVDVDKFEKEYAYGIRYNYGKEGKKKNWQPWDCMKIIMESVGAGENHGCPFRHHEGKILRKELEPKLKPSELNAIMQKVDEGHYQVACGMHFSAVHARDLSTGTVSHPNQWYLESRNMLQTEGNKNPKIKTTRVLSYSQQNTPTSQTTQTRTAEDTSSAAVMEEDDPFWDTDDADLISALDSVN